MDDKKFFDIDEAMVDYAEMSGFDFSMLDYAKTQELIRITGSEYANQPYTFKYGNYDTLDMLHSLTLRGDNA